MKTERYLALRHIHLPYTPYAILVISCLLGLVCLTGFAALNLGTTDVEFDRLTSWGMSFGQNGDSDIAEIMSLRAPRIAVALIGGALLAVSGYLLQIVSGNALADPGLLGLSQGTSATVVISSLVFNLPSQWLAPFGLIGGLGTAGFVLWLTFRLGLSNGLILIGIATGVILSSLTEIIIVAGGIERFASYATWSHGSLNAASLTDVLHLSLWAVLVLSPIFLVTRAMGGLELGEDQAAGLGVSPKRIRLVLTIFAAALIAPVVTIVGPISFVGLIAAHIARRIIGGRPGEVLLTSMLCGGLLLLGADLAGRTLFLPMIVPAGLIISVLGVLSFLAVASLGRFSKLHR